MSIVTCTTTNSENKDVNNTSKQFDTLLIVKTLLRDSKELKPYYMGKDSVEIIIDNIFIYQNTADTSKTQPKLVFISSEEAQKPIKGIERAIRVLKFETNKQVTSISFVHQAAGIWVDAKLQKYNHKWIILKMEIADV
jgi:hypothetical protein